MPDRFDLELRAFAADVHAETVRQFARAESWRDIAQGYRTLSDFVAHEQAAQLSQDPTEESYRMKNSRAAAVDEYEGETHVRRLEWDRLRRRLQHELRRACGADRAHKVLQAIMKTREKGNPRPALRVLRLPRSPSR
jgi:hypothetical protein